jgi:hypothetical protein
MARQYAVAVGAALVPAAKELFIRMLVVKKKGRHKRVGSPWLL